MTYVVYTYRFGLCLEFNLGGRHILQVHKGPVAVVGRQIELGEEIRPQYRLLHVSNCDGEGHFSVREVNGHLPYAVTLDEGTVCSLKLHVSGAIQSLGICRWHDRHDSATVDEPFLLGGYIMDVEKRVFGTVE